MSNGLLLVPPGYMMRNRIFKLDGSQRCVETRKPFIVLRETLSDRGFILKTADMSSGFSKAHAVIFFELPDENNPYYRRCLAERMEDRMYFIVGEPPAVLPADHDPKRHNRFRAILTFNDGLVDEKRYFRLDYTIPIRFEENVAVPRLPFRGKKLLCLVSSNKFSSYEKELYGERVKAIRFMERAHPAEFDLYGPGWEKPMIHAKWASAMKLNGVIYRFWPDNVRLGLFPSLKQSGAEKPRILPGYRFTIAYENCITPGYISEKMLEAMLYGCVPVYLGDPNVERRIPKDCFIDKREFPDYESLYRHLSGMNEKEHEGYLDRIEAFLNSDHVYPFTIDAFVESFERMLQI